MRAVLLIVFLLTAVPGLADEVSATRPNFDAELAAALGADDYGMRRHVMAFLKAGPNRPEDPVAAAALQCAHMAPFAAWLRACRADRSRRRTVGRRRRG